MRYRVDVNAFCDHYLFASLSDEALSSVAEAACRRVLRPNVHLFFQDDPADRFFLIRRGQIKLHRLAPDGTEKIVDIFGPGQTFAEATLFMKRRVYPVTASALGNTEVIGFSSRQFLHLLHSNTDTCFDLLGDLAMRLHHRLREIEHLSMKNASYRVVQFLLNELDNSPNAPERFRLRFQKQVMASRLSIQPETLSRIFQSLREAGVLDIDGRSVRINNLDALRQYC